MAKAKTPPPAKPNPPGEYTVVARRYRPQQFADLIGQEHVAQALVNALQTGRVAHAYLFTGARGVGKTSAARILAKALNCVKGPTPTPCDECESCKAVATGEDVDVLEIDGASNRGIDDARDIRENASYRPTRSRFKIYIIDEVHMLTKEAFNALLKTLEEPPPHVKFIFATTEVQKIPITILSRCQRFDFAHVGPGKIFEQLKRIVAREGLQAEDDALRLIARRAAGSMRDSQSLLDQLLSGVSGTLTVERVNAVLGSAGEERVGEIAAAILSRDVKQALELAAGWVESGLQPGELVDQLIGYWRSLMLVACGGPNMRELPLSSAQQELLSRQAETTNLDTVLAGLEVWTTTRARIRETSHTQTLVEMAIVRLCRMDELLSVGQLLQALKQTGSLTGGTGAAGANHPRPASIGSPDSAKKNGEMRVEVRAETAGDSSTDLPVPFTESALRELEARLVRALEERSPILAKHLQTAVSYAIFGPNSLVIRFPAGYNHACEACSTETSIQRIQETLRRLTGQPLTVRVELAGGVAPEREKPAAVTDRKQHLQTLPLFRKASESLGAQIWHVDAEFNPAAPPRQSGEPGETPPEANPEES